MNTGIYIKFFITILSFTVFLLSSNILQSNNASSQSRSYKFKEYKLIQEGIKVLLPDWEKTDTQNSSTKLQVINKESLSEINITVEPTTETLDSFWSQFYTQFKDLNSENIVTVQDTYLGELQSKLLFIKAKSTEQSNSCIHHSIYKNNLIILSYISPNDQCQNSFFTELSKIAITKL